MPTTLDLAYPFTGRWLVQNSPADRVPSHGTPRYASSVAGAYDAAGGLVQQVLPGGYAQAWTRNLAGQATAMAYTQTVGGTTTPILGFTQTHDHLGRVMVATGPAGSQQYSYDDRARLTEVQDTGTEGCTTRVYTFTGDSNRTALATYAPDADGACQTGTAAGTTSYSYDAADRITTTGYSYDRMGRTTTVPKAHTSNAADGLAGDLTVTYAANDMVASLQQTMANPDTGLAQARKQTFTLDGSDRVSTIKGYTDTVQLAETLNHYDSDTDSPAWTQTKTRPDTTTAWTTTWNRYASDLAGGLAIDVDNTGTAVLQLTNLHGDIIATTTLGQAGINTYTETNEYGQPKTGTTGGSSARYGWLGTHQRDTSVVGGLTLMGARLYAPATGRFLSVDPIPGGNDNRYTYPPDPINKQDLDGNYAFALAVFAIPGLGQVLAAVVIGVTLAYIAHKAFQYYAYSHKYSSASKPHNTRAIYNTKAQAVRAAKAKAAKTGGQFRPPCNAKRPHCHVDYRNAKGEKTHTIHYYWRNWRRLK